MKKLQTQFEVSTPVSGTSVLNGRKTITHYGDLLIKGIGYYEDGRYDCDLESIEWDNSNLLDLSLNITDLHSYCYDVAIQHLDKNWQPMADEIEYEMMRREEINMVDYANSLFKGMI
jgi:hypothetical protein